MKNTIGTRVNQLRQQLNIDSRELSEKSGLTIEQIDQIEKNNIVPSLSTLIRIARVLGVRIGTFLDDHENIGPVVCRKDTAIKGISFSNNNTAGRTSMSYYPLAAEKSGRHMEPFVIDIEPLAENYTSSEHEGEEFIYVLEGEVEIHYGKETIQLNAGDSIYYDSIVPHHVHSGNQAAAKILAVVYVPV